MKTLYEHAGGEEALRHLEGLFYEKVLADPVLKVLFTGRRPNHVAHLTWFTAEAFGGPERFTRELGFQHVIDVHRQLDITDEQRDRFVALYLETLDEAGLPADPAFRDAVRSHLDLGARVVQQNSRARTDAELHPVREVPRSRWPERARTVYEAVGGLDGLRRLAAAWHERVLADEVVSHAFSHGYHPQHTERLAAYWAEALGGPTIYSDRFGDETSVVRMHSGNGPHEEMDRRAIACFDQALEDVGLSGDERLRRVLHDYFAWATTVTMSRYHHSADDVAAGLVIPRWSWDGLVNSDGPDKFSG